MLPTALEPPRHKSLQNKISWFAQALFAPPFFPTDPDKTRRARLLNSIFLVAIAAMAFLVLGNAAGRNTPPLAIAIDLALMMLTLVCYGLMRRGWIRFTSYAWMLILILAVTVGSAVLGTIRTPTTSLFFPILVAAGLLVDRRTMLLGAIVSAFAVAGLIFAENAGWLPTPNYSVSVTQWVTFAIGFGLVSIMVYFSVRETRQALEQVKVELLQRQEAETALYQLTNELGERVLERTRDLSTANTQLQAELAIRQQRENELALRLCVTQLLASSLSVSALILDLLPTLGQALGWQVVEFYLFDEKQTHAEISTYWSEPDPRLQEFVENSDRDVFPFNAGIPLQVRTTHRAVWLADASIDPTVLRAKALQRAGLRGGAGFPIQIADTTCGMFFMFSRNVRPYDAAQVELLNQIGSELSQFIIRTRNEKQLHDAQAQLAQQVFNLESSLVKINAIHSITQDGVRDLGLNELLQGICNTLVEALKADRVSLIALDVETKRIEHFVTSGPGANKILDVSFDELWDGLSGWAIRQGRAALSPKNTPDPRESDAVQRRRVETDCGSILVMPLLYQDKLVGTLTAINRPDQKDFDNSDVELMLLIANQAATTVEHKRDRETMRYQNEFLSALNRVTLDLLNHKERGELLDALLRAATQLLEAPFGQIFLADDDALVVAAFTPNLSARLGDRITRNNSQLAWKAFETRQPASVDDYATWEYRRRLHDSVGVHAAVDFPIYTDEKRIGVLALGRAVPNYLFDTAQLRYGSLFAQLAAVVLENLELRESLREQAMHDPLTGLYNRRYMHEWLTGELQRAQRENHATSVLMLDVDHFKRLNDHYGHRAGDTVLQEIGAYLKTHLRGSDMACRYGGEEFLLILPGVPPATALRRAEQIRGQIQALALRYQDTSLPAATVSIGIALFPQHGGDVDTLISAADTALYQAKRAGRNRVKVAV